jgi:hypothetical protein
MPGKQKKNQKQRMAEAAARTAAPSASLLLTQPFGIFSYPYNSPVAELRRNLLKIMSSLPTKASEYSHNATINIAQPKQMAQDYWGYKQDLFDGKRQPLTRLPSSQQQPIQQTQSPDRRQQTLATRAERLDNLAQRYNFDWVRALFRQTNLNAHFGQELNVDKVWQEICNLKKHASIDHGHYNTINNDWSLERQFETGLNRKKYNQGGLGFHTEKVSQHSFTTADFDNVMRSAKQIISTGQQDGNGRHIYMLEHKPIKAFEISDRGITGEITTRSRLVVEKDASGITNIHALYPELDKNSQKFSPEEAKRWNRIQLIRSISIPPGRASVHVY